jgi:hypothetical protein
MDRIARGPGGSTVTCKTYPNDLLQQVYGGQNCQPDGHLPYTGFQVALFLVIAGALIVTGIVLRWGSTD